MGLVFDCKITQNRADTQAKAPLIARRSFGVRYIVHNIHVLLEHGRGIDGERCAGLEARKRLDEVLVEVGKRKVHNLLRFSAKLWTV